MTYKEIPSYCDYHWFYEMIFKNIPEGGSTIEVGVWFGHGVAFMSHLSKESKKKLNVYAVDTFKGSNEPTHKKVVESHGGNIYFQFDDYMKQTGSDVVALIGESMQMSEHFEDNSIDFIYLDASHDYENVCKDIISWMPKVKEGGVLAGHDYNSWGGVTQAVNELLPGKQTEKNVWWFNKPKKYDGQEY